MRGVAAVYRLAPADEGWTSKQLYFPDTNVLITRFLTPDGVGEVEDFMPIAQTIDGGHRQRLVRRVVACAARCASRWSARRASTTAAPNTRSSAHEHGVLFRSAGCALAFGTETPLRSATARRGPRSASRTGESATFVLEHVAGAYEPHGAFGGGDARTGRGDGRLLAALAVAVALHRAAGARWCTARR